MIWTRQAKALTDRALSLSKAEETPVTLTGDDRANLRFARNTATTSGAARVTARHHARFGKRSGTVTTSEFEEARLERAVRTQKRSRGSHRRILS